MESYLIPPVIQQETFSLPPALMIISQLLMLILTVSLALALTISLTAVLIVLARMIYIEEVLKEYWEAIQKNFKHEKIWNI